MNDLLSRSFFRNEPDNHRNNSVEMTSPPNTSADLEKFFEDVESVKNDLKEVENIHRRLLDSHEQSKTLHNSNSIKNLRSKMDADVTLALKKAKLIKLKLESLDQSNAVSRTRSESGPGSSSDRTRTSVVNSLRKKLTESMSLFNALRNEISNEYRDTVKRRYFTVTGTNPDEHTLDVLIETGESESFLKKAIEEQGRGRVMDTIVEIRERYDGVKEMERNLMELHQVFLDMSVLVEVQGEQLDDIESQVLRASSFVVNGTESLTTARKLQKNTRKWTCYAIVIVLLIVLFVVLFTLRPWENRGGSGGGGTVPVGRNPPAPTVVSPPPPAVMSPPPPVAK